MRFRTEPDGNWYDFDAGRLMVKEARQLEELTGMGLNDFGQGLQRGKVDALVFMIFLAKRRCGEAVRWADFDDLDIAKLEIEPDEAEVKAMEEAQRAAAEEAENPPAPPTQRGGGGGKGKARARKTDAVTLA